MFGRAGPIRVSPCLLPYYVLFREATEALEKALVVVDAALLSTHLEHAKSVLGQLAGDTVSEELLDRLFNQFCIGK